MKYCCVFVIALLLCSSVYGQDKQQKIPANHPNVQYMGRVKIQDDKAQFNWPGVVVSARFTGDELGICIKGGERNYFNIHVDDRPPLILHAVNDTVWWYPERLKKAEHCLRIVKRTEADMGMAEFSGLYIGKKASMLTPKTPPQRKIMFIGNSITCGYGTEGKDRTERFSPKTENCEQSYATIIARAFDAQYHLVSHSGLGMVRNYGDKDTISVKLKPMPARLKYLFDNDSTELFDLNRFIPDAVFINLGTNDFSTHPFPDEERFCKAGEELVVEILNRFPGVKVFCITGPMINEPCYTYTKKIVESVRVTKNTSDVVFIGVPRDLVNSELDLGSDSHPSYRGQIKTAKLILPVASTVLDWDYLMKDQF